MPDTAAILARLRAASVTEPPDKAAPTSVHAPTPAAPPPAPGGLTDGAKRALEAALAEQVGPMAHLFARQVFADAGSAADASSRVRDVGRDLARAERFLGEVRRRLGVV